MPKKEVNQEPKPRQKMGQFYHPPILSINNFSHLTQYFGYNDDNEQNYAQMKDYFCNESSRMIKKNYKQTLNLEKRRLQKFPKKIIEAQKRRNKQGRWHWLRFNDERYIDKKPRKKEKLAQIMKQIKTKQSACYLDKGTKTRNKVKIDENLRLLFFKTGQLPDYKKD